MVIQANENVNISNSSNIKCSKTHQMFSSDVRRWTTCRVFIVSKFKVTVFTGDKFGAGTDANVSCTLFGDLGESNEMKLDTSKNNFERAM